jgi:hypothetical protein
MNASRAVVLTILAATSITVPTANSVAWAQNPVSANSGAPKPVPETLQSFLETAVWDAVARGPLITVAPESALPAWKAATRRPQYGLNGKRLPVIPPPVPQPQQDGRFRVTDLTEYFGRRVVRLKGLTVLAPSEMVVLNTQPGKPDYAADLWRSDKMEMIEATLTEEQWKLLGSDQGLGVNDLSDKGRKLFLSYLSDPMVFVTWSAYLSKSDTEPAEKPILLSGSQRNSIRLRLQKSAEFTLPMEGGPYSRLYVPTQPTTEKYVLVSKPFGGPEPDTLFGQQIRRLVPSRLKPQQIDFSAPVLRTAVSLSGLKTVGELVERIRNATRTEIYVDARAAKRTLWIRATETQTVRAGDALQALCWGLTGAIRFVSDGESNGVFLLTEDIEGIGSRLTRLRDWAESAQFHAIQTAIDRHKVIQKQSPMRFVRFPKEDFNALEGKVAEAVDKGIRNDVPTRWRGVSVPIADFSPQQQETIRKAATAYETNITTSGRRVALIKDGTASVFLSTKRKLILPGLGEVDDSNANTMASLNSYIPFSDEDSSESKAPTKPAPPLTIPREMPLGGALCVSPATETEAIKAVRAAQERGLKQLWIVLPVTPASSAANSASLNKARTLLGAAIREAGTVQIIAGVRLFGLPDTEPEKMKDRTITGELPLIAARRRVETDLAVEQDPDQAKKALAKTHDWVPPQTDGLSERLAQHLKEIAQTPGLSGLALLDTAPPGYGQEARGPVYLPDYTTAVGYTPAARLAYIRAHSCDPIDITMDTLKVGNVNIRLPYFAEDDPRPPVTTGTSASEGRSATPAAWAQFCSEAVSRVLGDLHHRLLPSLPTKEGGFPVYLQTLDSSVSSKGWFSRWDKAAALPRLPKQEPGKPLNLFAAAQSFSPLSLIDITYGNYSEVVPTTARFSEAMNLTLDANKGKWEGIVLNFSDVSVEKALEALQGQS